ncbi:hypothetical protein FHU35_121154 [Saccharopolyspora dendranthemae]|uniref:Uncharacterized protein n=1 Tax=Saccharopolyspora dendranthemae TaxID=1181886 RepID=A0A561U9W2_9PSEU|nr:hypothetical protein FHU35_121154 [Saccharopolyspora dendranthemae]
MIDRIHNALPARGLPGDPVDTSLRPGEARSTGAAL